MTNETKEFLLDKIAEMYETEDKGFFGTEKDFEKELYLKDLAECAAVLLKMNKISSYKIMNDNDSPNAMVQVEIAIPTAFVAFDYSAEILSDMFLKSDTYVFAHEEESNTNNVIVTFIIKDYWIEA